MKAGTVILIGLGVVVAGGVGIYFATKPSTSTTPNPQTPDTARAPGSLSSACQNANQLAAIASASNNPENERQSYNYWAAQCRAGGGNPNPFPA
jgi:uncharacterized protein (UPF0333 family)